MTSVNIHTYDPLRLAKLRLHRMVDRYDRSLRSFERMLDKAFHGDMLQERLDFLNKKESNIYDGLKFYLTKGDYDFNINVVLDKMISNPQAFDLATLNRVEKLASKLSSIHKEILALENVKWKRHSLSKLVDSKEKEQIKIA